MGQKSGVSLAIPAAMARADFLWLCMSVGCNSEL